MGADLKLLEHLGKVAGIAGIALGVFLLLFRDIIRKQIFPQLDKAQAFALLRTMAFLVWSVAIAGIGAWVSVQIFAKPSVAQTAENVRRYDEEFVRLQEALLNRTLSVQESKEVDELYQRRAKLKEDWNRDYAEFSKRNQAEPLYQRSFEGHQLATKLNETADEIDSIDRRLAELEHTTLHHDARPPLPPGNLHIVTPSPSNRQ